MKTPLATILIALSLCLSAAAQSKSPQSVYVITGHHQYEYIIRHGQTILKVKYSESQTNNGEGAFPLFCKTLNCVGTHLHQLNGEYPLNADLSQIPALGTRILQCVMAEPDQYGPWVAIQPTPAPCMVQNGNTLQYVVAPNGPKLFEYVNFDIISERLTK